jgi:hypothetical protein
MLAYTFGLIAGVNEPVTEVEDEGLANQRWG